MSYYSDQDHNRFYEPQVTNVREAAEMIQPPIKAELPPRTETEIRQHLVEQRELTNELLTEIKDTLKSLLDYFTADKSQPSQEQGSEQGWNNVRTSSPANSQNKSGGSLSPLF